jgi:hypothetical protein
MHIKVTRLDEYFPPWRLFIFGCFGKLPKKNKCLGYYYFRATSYLCMDFDEKWVFAVFRPIFSQTRLVAQMYINA